MGKSLLRAALGFPQGAQNVGEMRIGAATTRHRDTRCSLPTIYARQATTGSILSLGAYDLRATTPVRVPLAISRHGYALSTGISPMQLTLGEPREEKHMKVIGMGAPERLTVRFAPSERALVVDELDHARAGLVDRLAALHGRRADVDHDGLTEECHARLAALHQVLSQIEQHHNVNDTFTVAAPTTFLGSIIRGTARTAAENLVEAVAALDSDQGQGSSRQTLRDAAGTAQAAAATLIAYDLIVRGGTPPASIARG
jgi:hypothetical protein